MDVDNQDMVEVADALTDLLYVVYGAGHAFGIDLDECFAEVHRSNLSKLGPDFKPIKGKMVRFSNLTHTPLLILKLYCTTTLSRNGDRLLSLCDCRRRPSTDLHYPHDTNKYLEATQNLCS